MLKFRRLTLSRLRLARVGLLAATAVAAMLAVTAGSAAAATTYPYTFTNADGSTTVIAQKPKRVVVTGVPYSYPGSVIAAGGNVVGAQPYQPPGLGLNPANGFPAWLPNSDKITSIGYFASAAGNLETIASLQPDLIVAQSTFQPADLNNLRAIAPVITLPPAAPTPPSGPQDAPITWEYFLQKLGPVFDSVDRTNAYIDRINLRASALKGFVSGQTVTQVVPAGVGGGASFQQSNASNSLRFLAKAGFTIAPFIDAPIDTSISGNSDQQRYYSTEYLSKVNADFVILQTNSNLQVEYSQLPGYSLIPSTSKVLRVTVEWGLFDPFDTLATLSQFGPRLLDVTMLEAVVPGREAAVLDFYTQPKTRKACLTATYGSLKPTSVALLDRDGDRVASLGRPSTNSVCKTLPQRLIDRVTARPGDYRIGLVQKVKAKKTKTKKKTTKTKTIGKGTLAPLSTSLAGLPTT